MKRLLLALAVVCLASPARAQDWTRVFSSPGSTGITPYFLNVNVGFRFNAGILFYADGLYQPGMGVYGGLYLPDLSRTTNGGLTWSALNFFDTSGYLITQLSFVSLTHGYASASSNHSFNNGPVTGGIFETFDQGSHWKKITSDGLSFSGVYATNDAIFASEIGNTIHAIDGAILYSHDDGATWDSITNVSGLTFGTQPQFQFIDGNRDSLVATVYFTNSHGTKGNNGDTYLVFSTDLGKTWNSSLLDQSYWCPMISLHISPHSCNIVREFLDYQDQIGDTYSFLESSPPYDSWDSALMHRETGAWVAGTSCESYLSDAAVGDGPGDLNTSVLLFRSTDEGVSWKPILKESGGYANFGEMDDVDFQNISAVGYGAVIFTSGFYGDLWKTTNGGDGSLSAAMLAPRMALGHTPFATGNDTLDIDCGSPGFLAVHNQDIACSYGKFDSISLVGLDPLEYSVISTHHCACQPMPDTSFITLQPKTAGTRDVTIHYHFTDDEFNQIDTSIAIVLVVKPGGTSVVLGMYLKSSAIIARGGDTIDIPVYLSGNVSLAGATSLSLPFALDTNMLRVLSFNPAVSGITVGSLSYSKGTETVPLQASDLTVNGETLIGTLRCIVYLTDTLQTSVSLAGATLSSEDSRCVSLSLQTNAVNIALTGCGDSTLLHFMKNGTFPTAIASIAPNPVTSSLLVQWSGGGVTYDITDALGILREHNLATSGQSEIDVRSWPSGVYYIRARGASGMVSMRRFIVAR